MIENWVLVYQAEEEYQAELIKQLLERHELHPVIMDKKGDEFGLPGLVSVFVSPEEAGQAKEIISGNTSEQE